MGFASASALCGAATLISAGALLVVVLRLRSPSQANKTFGKRKRPPSSAEGTHPNNGHTNPPEDRSNEPSLDEIGRRYLSKALTRTKDKYTGGDKTSAGLGFTSHYDRILAPFRHRHKVCFVEIGVWYGKSLAMFADYFTSGTCTIYGIDIDLGRFREHRPELVRLGAFGRNDVSVHSFDTKSEAFAAWAQQTLSNHADGADIVLDDGDHSASSQWQLFTLLFPLVAHGGLYIIEDIEFPAEFFCGRFQATGFAAIVAAVANPSFFTSKAIDAARESVIDEAKKNALAPYEKAESSLLALKRRLVDASSDESVRLKAIIARKEEELSSMQSSAIFSRGEENEILAKWNEQMKVIEALSRTVDSVELRHQNVVFRKKVFQQLEEPAPLTLSS